MPTSRSHLNPSKFTRGEKCIFAHVVITFVGIMAVVFAYYGHSRWVRHGARELALSGRPSLPAAGSSLSIQIGPKYRCVGLAYVRSESGERAACGTAAVRASWSLASARCVAARANPHLAHLLPRWTLRYDDHSTGVLRGAAHPHYDHEGAAADVGLFEHERALPLTEHDEPQLCTVPNVMRHEVLTSEWTDLFIVGWRPEGERWVARADALPAVRCTRLAAPVAPATDSSLCLVLHPGSEAHLPRPLLGAVVFEDSRLVGITSWGGAGGTENTLPIIVVHIAPFKHWLETTMKLL